VRGDYTCVYTHDIPFAPSILHVLAAGAYTVRPRYADLRCQSCGKIDERLSLSRGFDVGIKVKSRRDAHQSEDDLHIVDRRLRRILENIPGIEIAFYSIPGNATHCVAIAKRVYLPIAGHPAFECIELCGICGRYRDAIWGSGQYELQERIPMGAVHLESRHGIMPVWFFSSDVANDLMNIVPKVTGLFFEQSGKRIIGP
jgi:hypothetical protein